MADLWGSLRGLDSVELARLLHICLLPNDHLSYSSFLAYVKSWQYYGATVVQVQLAGSVPQRMLLAVHELGTELLTMLTD